MSKQLKDRVIIGQFGKPFGVKGWVSLRSFMSPADNILGFSHWFVEQKNGWSSVQIEEIKPHKKSYIAKLDRTDDRDEVAKLTNAMIAVDRDALPELEPGEHYWADLMGFEVVAEQGQSFGQLIDVLETGANDVMVVKGDRERLIPFIEGEYVTQVDPKARQIRVQWDPEF